MADFGDILRQRWRKRFSRTTHTDAERRADLDRYALVSILKRMFDVDYNHDSAGKVDALRVAMMAKADEGYSCYYLDLGFDPLHAVTIETINDSEQFNAAKQYIYDLLNTESLTVHYQDDRDRVCGCSVGTQPTLIIGWDIESSEESEESDEIKETDQSQKEEKHKVIFFEESKESKQLENFEPDDSTVFF